MLTTNNDEQFNISEGNCDELDICESSPEPTANAVKRKRTKAEIAVNVILWIAIIVLAALVTLRLFVFNSVVVDGESMMPTFESGEIVVVNKIKSPKRGDVAIFYLRDVDNKFKALFAGEEECQPGQPYEKLIKRVVAIEGDKIWAQRIPGESDVYQVVVQTTEGKRYCEDYYVKNGEKLKQDVYFIYADAPSGLGILANYSEQNPLVISKGCFFAMGDHRVNSRDSREFGEFPLSRMFGVVIDR